MPMAIIIFLIQKTHPGYLDAGFLHEKSDHSLNYSAILLPG
ncbi:hypothetical protein UF75_0516 [Desulfosporosinus sp. I2]|nr:hypothetical protein UF75_0516 [Desulfosporosinus sp. I2]